MGDTDGSSSAARSAQRNNGNSEKKPVNILARVAGLFSFGNKVEQLNTNEDLLNLKQDSESIEIENLIKDVIYLPEYTTSLSALNILRENKASFACVIDENGGIEGVITIKDVLSEFVGDLPDEHDQRFTGIKRLGPGQWTIEGKTDIDDFEEFFGLDPNDKDVATVGGLFLSHSEQLPSQGEKITLDGLEITVMEVDNRRIESVVVKKIAKK